MCSDEGFYHRNTLCITRKNDDIRAQIFRQMLQMIYSVFTLEEMKSFVTLHMEMVSKLKGTGRHS